MDSQRFPVLPARQPATVSVRTLFCGECACSDLRGRGTVDLAPPKEDDFEDVRDPSGRSHEMTPSLEETPLLAAPEAWHSHPQEPRLMSGITSEQRTVRRYGRAPTQADSRSPGVPPSIRGFCSTPQLGSYFSPLPGAVRRTSRTGRARSPETRTWLIKCLSTRRIRRKLGWSCCAAIG